MKPFLITLCILLFFPHIYSQDRSGNTWCFGSTAELNWNTGAPTPVSGCAIQTNEGCASISNRTTGALLFYSDGTNVWNANNTIMPSNTIPLGGNTSATQSAIIVPDPGSSTKYYLFTVDWQAGLLNYYYGTNGNGGVSYTIIDMTLDGGLGDVSQQPQSLVTPTCEKITATKMANNQGYWMVTHLWNSTTFYAYPVTASGIGAPVATDIGISIYDLGTGSGQEAIGYMKISPDGSKIAIAHDYGFHTVQVFNFNNATGVISGEILSDNSQYVYYYDEDEDAYNYSGPYGVSFSPNSKLLYMSLDYGGDPDATQESIYQYNLSAGSPASVLASRNVVGTISFPFAIQLAPDQKLYIADGGADEYLERINDPNVYGTGCNFETDAVDLLYGNSIFGLPDFPEDLFGSIIATLTYSNCSGDTTITFVDTTVSGTATYSWNFGDPSSGTSNTSTIDTATHVFSGSGTYDVTLTVTTSAGSFTVSKSVVVNKTPPAIQISTTGSGTCGHDSVQLTASSSGSVTYLWSPQTGLSCVSCANPFANPDSTTEYYVQGTEGGCVAHDSVKVTVGSAASPVTVTSETTTMCPGDSAYVCAPAGYSSYLWNTGDTTPCIYAQSAGNYYLTATDNNNCTASSNHLAINVYQSPPVQISANGDTLVSYGAVTYQWYLNGAPISGATQSTYIAHQGGSYTVNVTDTNGCTESSSPLTTGIAELNGNEWVKVYPNPSTGGNWQLSVSQDLIGSMVEIYDDNGRLVYKSEVRNPVSNLALEVARGVYTLRLTSGGTSYNLKVIKL